MLRESLRQLLKWVQIPLLREDSLSSHPREFPCPARLAHVEPPLLAAKPLASARAREANRSASAAEPLVEVWPISHTFGVLIRRGWDFGKCAVDLAESDEERKRSEKPESPLVKYVRPQRPALFQHLTLNSDIQEGTKLESYHGRQRQIALGSAGSCRKVRMDSDGGTPFQQGVWILFCK
ncbi:hypothetical protein AB1E18_007305 [Capra hircus]